MHHGCYKLCPKLREQLRKAQKGREISDDEDSSSDERPIEVAGPSEVQKVRSPSVRRGEESHRYPSSATSPKRTKTTKHPGISSDSLTGRTKTAKHPGISSDSPTERTKTAKHPGTSSIGPTERTKTTKHPGTSSDSLTGRTKTAKHPGISSDSLTGRRKTAKHPGISSDSLTERTKTAKHAGTSSISPTERTKRAKHPETSSDSLTERTKTAKHPGSSSNSPTESRRFDLERRAQRRSQGSQFSRREHVPGVGKKGIDGRRHPEVDKPGPSRKIRGRRREYTSDDDDEERSINGHEFCGSNCRIRKKRIKDEPERSDGYVVNKTFSYFADLCNCNYACLMNQLWKDPFVTSTMASAAVFAVGVKLCSELNGWTI